MSIYPFLFALLPIALHAGPTSTFWTNCTTTCVPPESFKTSLSTFFSLEGKGSLPPDIGIEYGFPCFHGITGEAGIDYLGGSHDPLYFNGKITVKEGHLFSHAPSFSLGIFNAGTKTHGKNRTNQNIADAVLGHSLPTPLGGAFYAGVFSGAKAMGKDRQGGMIAYNRPFCRIQDPVPYHRWVFSADYASGKNTIGGTSLALTYYFTPKINVQTGPIWFNSKKINGSWKWSIQVVAIL